jgi:hypothetical protein
MQKSGDVMGKSRKRKRDPLPEQFNSVEEAGEIWDTHSGADYEEYMEEVHFEVSPHLRSVFVQAEARIRESGGVKHEDFWAALGPRRKKGTRSTSRRVKSSKSSR